MKAWWRSLSELFQFIVIMSIMVVVVLGIVAGGVKVLGEVTCSGRQEAYSRNTEYWFWTNTCWVELDNGSFIESDKYEIQVNLSEDN